MTDDPLHRVTSYAENPHEAKTSAAFGHALRILWLSELRHEPLRDLARRTWPPILLGQIEFLFDSKGIPIAFATWAFLDDACVEALRADPDHELHLSDWNEGCRLWIVDLVAPAGQVANLARKLRHRLAGDHRRVAGLRRYARRPAVRFVDLGWSGGR